MSDIHMAGSLCQNRVDVEVGGAAVDSKGPTRMQTPHGPPERPVTAISRTQTWCLYVFKPCLPGVDILGPTQLLPSAKK